MKVWASLIGLLSLLSTVLALAKQNGDGETTSTTAATWVWVTYTTDGILTTASSKYTQSFSSVATTANTDDVKSGEVGLGSSSGSVGSIRTYTRTTINEGVALYAPGNLYAGFAGLCFLLVGALL